MASPTNRGDTSALWEQPNSPAWTFGERVSCRRTFKGTYALALASAPLRGTLGGGAMTGMRVSQSNVTRDRGATGVLVIDYETNGEPAQGGQLPPVEETLAQDKLEIVVEKHPIFDDVPENVRRAIRAYVDAPNEAERSNFAWALDVEDANYSALNDKLYEKLSRGVQSYVIFPPVLRQVDFSWDPFTSISAGGVIETPATDIDLPPDTQWLRQADQVSWNGSQWRIERSWLGAPAWDVDLYS